jgi:hypothetical protein
MPDAFTLRWKLDRPFLPQNQAEDIYVLLTIEPNTTGLAMAAPAGLPVHIVLLVDVSGSMDFLMRHDPKAKSVGQGVTEGRAADRVESDIPSRREMATSVVHKLAERLGNDDVMTLVAFDDKAYVLAQGLSPANLDKLWPAIQKLSDVGGGGTDMGQGLDAIRAILTAAPDSARTRKLVILTDGEDQHPAKSLAQAEELCRQFHIPIAAFGTGECKVAFLSSVAKTTLAGSFNHIRSELDAEQFFHQVFAAQKTVHATNVALKLWLSPEIHVRELYRTRPEILFVGDMQPDKQNVVELRLEQMEAGKAYEFLYRCTVPPRQASQRMRIAKATLAFDLPSHEQANQTIDSNIVVEFTDKEEKARERSGDVRRVLSRAEVQRQVLFLQEKADLFAQGKGTDRDRGVVAKLLAALIQKFTEFGDQAMVNQYKVMHEELQRKGTISQEMLNRSLAASSRAEELIVAQDIDF